MRITCRYCGKKVDKPNGAVRRARKLGAPMFCNKKHAGLGRRKHKPKSQRKAEKAAYDRGYRKKNLARITAGKKQYHKRTYDPVKAAKERKKRMPRHVEYCRQPKYRAYKQRYDRQYRAAKDYGPFADVAILTTELTRETKRRMTKSDIKQENQTNCKRYRRRHEGA